MSSVLGLDVGSKRIGVALASLEARIASPLTTLNVEDYPDVTKKITELVNDNNCEHVVVGLPRGMNGQETNQTAIVREFARKLKASTEAKVYLQDEAGTSILAEEELNRKKKPYTKGDIDKLAATYILHDWLSGANVEEL